MLHLVSSCRQIARFAALGNKLPVRCLSYYSSGEEDFSEEGGMSYRHGGAGGVKYGGRGGRGGPNRGGGRGRGGGGGRGHRGGGRGGGPPPGLSGKEIGMFYARRSKAKKEEQEKSSRAVVSIDREAERDINKILSNVRRQSDSGQAADHFSGRRHSGHSQPTHSQADHTHTQAGHSHSQASRSHPEDAWCSLEPVERTSQASSSQASLGEPSRETVGEPSGASGWYFDTEGMMHEEMGMAQEAGTAPPPGFSTRQEEALNSSEGTDGISTHASLGGGASEEATPMSWEAGREGRSDELDAKLRDELLEAQSKNMKYKKMLEFRQNLPSWKAQEEVLQLVKSSQVSVISGETGCGKTTQVPQFILDDAIMNGWGSRCHVICTQPRRISAISVAQRVAAERGESLGESSGFQIRLENTLPRTRGSILYCTTGILLRRLITDPLLLEVSHVIMDEIHERNLNSDFLTIIMKDLLPRRAPPKWKDPFRWGDLTYSWRLRKILFPRPDLKLILMSATINAELFSAYFNNAPMYKIQNVAYPVTEYFLEDIFKMTRYTPQGSRQSKPRPHWSRYGQGRIDYEKQQEEEREKEEYLTALAARRTFPMQVIDSLREFDDKDIDLDLITSLVKYICLNMGEGAILIFLPGWDTISKLHDMLKASPVFGGRQYLIIPLHSMMPTVNQQKVFDRPPEGVRKIVIATNIAETSITIDDVVFVVDGGKVKETTYDAAHQMACLDSVWVSKAAARQRRGRAGRVQAGHCFHVFSKLRHDKMAEFQLPEMLRTPLEELVLQIKILKLGKALPFLQKAIEPPKEEAVRNAIQCLRDLRALVGDEELTPLGHHLANLPVNPRIGKIILFGAMFSCLDPILTIASALGFKEPFVIPLHKQEEADAIKRRFAAGTRSDHIALLKAYQGWEDARSYGDARSYCWENFLANNTLELLRNMKQQFAGLLYDTGFIPSSHSWEESSNVNSDNMKLVKAVLCAGLYPNVIKIQQNKPGSHPKLFTRDGKVKFHPKSVNCDEKDFENKYMIYHTKVKSSAVFVHDSTMIPPFPLLFFGGDISVQRDRDQETIAVDDWIIFQASQKIAELVKEMRKQLDSVLQQKVAHPRMELYSPLSHSPPPTSQLIQAIIDLITREDYTQQAERLAAGKHLYVRGK